MSEYGSVTQCPHCKTSFHVGPIQLEAADGRVRCGGCLKVFDAREHFLVEQKPLFGFSENVDDSFAEEQSEEFVTPADSIFIEEDIAPSDMESISRTDRDDELTEGEETQDFQSDIDSVPLNPSTFRMESLEEIEQPARQEDWDELEQPPTASAAEDIDSSEEDEDAEISSMLEESFEEIEQNLSDSVLNKNETWEPDNKDWERLMVKRASLDSDEPILVQRAPQEPQITEEEQLAEQLFVGSTNRKVHSKFALAWNLVISFLVLLLLAQCLYWQPTVLRKINFYNRVSINYCALLPCRELILEDLSQLSITGVVRPSGQYRNALSVQMELRNRAELAQRFPYIELAFTDLKGEKISLRRFSPQEYLRAETAGRTSIAPYQRIQIELELYDPGASAISYEFNLMYLN